VTEYKLNHFTMADAQALAGKTAVGRRSGFR